VSTLLGGRNSPADFFASLFIHAGPVRPTGTTAGSWVESAGGAFLVCPTGFNQPLLLNMPVRCVSGLVPGKINDQESEIWPLSQNGGFQTKGRWTLRGPFWLAGEIKATSNQGCLIQLAAPRG
jgi:hypothetical protein